MHRNDEKQLKCYICFMVMFHMFQVIYAHEWMNDAHDHEMQVQLGKTNTRGVTHASLDNRHNNRSLFLIIVVISFALD